MAEGVLDASAPLAVLGNEPGSDRVLPFLGGGRISSVNLAEVLSKLVDMGMPLSVAEDVVDRLGLQMEPLDRDGAVAMASLRDATRSRGLSIGDRACLALARRLGVVAVTADRAWAGLDDVAEISVIR